MSHLGSTLPIIPDGSTTTVPKTILDDLISLEGVEPHDMTSCHMDVFTFSMAMLLALFYFQITIQLGVLYNSLTLIRLFSKISQINNNLQMVTHLSTVQAHGCLTNVMLGCLTDLTTQPHCLHFWLMLGWCKLETFKG